jgi:1-acyl-sn-glycerol-3-phosphate acyltransferase
MLYFILWPLAWLVFKLFFRLKIEGKHNVPTPGPLIIAANHKSYLDPIVLILASKRRIYFMAKSELFRIPLFNWLIRILGAFSVERAEADRQAFRKALEILSDGKILGLFPEGTRIRHAVLGPLESGVALIALKSGAPILPIGIIGADKVMPKGSRIPRLPRLKVRIGEPIYAQDRVTPSPGREPDSATKKETINTLLATLAQKLHDLLSP